MTKLKTSKNISISIFAIFAICLSFLAMALLGTPVYAYSQPDTTLSNLNFSSNGNKESVYSTPSGWQKGFAQSTATSGAINLDYYDENQLYIEQNEQPEKLNQSADSHVLMINSKNKNSQIPNVQYYTNNSSLTLNPYSNYKIVVWVQVTQSANASVYLTGMEHTLGFERINVSLAEKWTDFTFYVTTGINSESVKLELWLGSKPENTSSGAVFFDNVSVYKISNNMTPNIENNETTYVSAPTATNRTKYINLDSRTLAKGIDENDNVIDINSNFESLDLSDWSYTVDQMKVGSHINVVNLKTDSESNSKGIPYLKLDNTKGSSHALVLYTDDNIKSYFGLKSPNINLPIYSTFKVSVNVKVAGLDGGSAYIKFEENDVLDSNGDKIEAITATSKEITISENTENGYLNDYTTCTFYVKARSLYNSTFNLSFWLGSKDAESCGAVAFDNILIEQITHEQFSSTTANSTNVKIDLQENTEDYGIKNATFNLVSNSSNNFPLIPTSWSHETQDENKVYFGVINTQQAIYNKHVTDFGGYLNPGNPEGFLGTDIDTNNVLKMSNITETYQTVTSEDFDVSASKYYKLSFAYKLSGAEDNGLLNVYVKDSDSNTLYSSKNIYKTNENWNNYEIYISTNAYTNSLNICIGLGNSENLVVGTLYLDNIVIKEQADMTAEQYAQIAQNNNVLDFQEGSFNLIQTNDSGIHTALRFNGSLTRGEQTSDASPLAIGGIIDGSLNEFDVENSPNNENVLKYMMMIKTFADAEYSMTAKDTLSLTNGSYYKFTIDIKTVFTGDLTKEKDNFGAEFGLTGIDQKISNIISEEWQTYTIYVNCTTSTDVNLKFALNSLNLNTSGMAFFDNYKYEVIDSDTFNVDHTQYSNLSNYLFVGDTDKKEDSNADSSSANLDYIWYVIPSLILAFAILLALISYLTKKVRIKKWEKRKVNEYDRDRTVFRDVIRHDAEKIRDAQIKELKQQESQVKAQIAELQQKQQEHFKNAKDRKVTKQAEKEFKSYAKISTALENKLASINKNIEYMNSAEFLLSVQHKLAVEKAKQERISKEKTLKSNKKKTKK